jgi:hypothetical protein
MSAAAADSSLRNVITTAIHGIESLAGAAVLGVISLAIDSQ